LNIFVPVLYRNVPVLHVTGVYDDS
jgi:hypothetical protein